MGTRRDQTGTNTREWVSALAIAGLIAGGSVRPALADEPADSGTPASSGAGLLEEIVVTAQKRSERLIDVPMSVTAITGDSLQQQGAVDYGDYLPTVPGVSYAKTGFLDKIFIRGLADSMSSQATSTTGIYLDEANLTESQSNIGDVGTFDVARVEVLRGPQGTLYGDSSMGGTIRIITNKPDLTKFDAIFDGTLSYTDHGGLNDVGNVVLNAPIIDGILGVRFAGGYSHDDGFIDNVVTGRTDINPVKTEKVRFLTQFDPLEQLHMLLSFNYVDSDQDYGPFQDLGQAQYHVARYFPEFSDYRMKLYGLTVNYDFGWAGLTSATNYLDKFNQYGRDFTGSTLITVQGAFPNNPLPHNTGVGLLFNFPNRLFTEEVRLTSKTEGAFHWLVGAYYSLFKPPASGQQYVSTAPITQDFNIYTSEEHLRRSQIAGFGELTWSATNKLDFTVGLRQFHFQTRNESYSSGYLAGGGTTPTTTQSSSEASHVTKYRVSYKLTSDNLVYVQAAQGYRPGGPLGSFTSDDLANLESLGFNSTPTQYTSDKVWDYEVGSKNEFLNGLFSVSGDAYYIDWTDIQIALNLADGTQLISNAGKATSKGFELETAAHPITGLDLQASAALTDATFSQTLPSIQTVAGAQLPNVPRWTYSFSGVYSHELANEVRGYLRSDLTHVGARLNDLAGKSASQLFVEPSYTTLNLRMGARFSGWDTALFVNNVTNDQAILNTKFVGFTTFQAFNTPRTVGLNVRKEL
jgi:outer membrane receptor protein involved in Fe transport